MLKVVDRFNRTREHVALRSMFEARKRFFVDELGWDLPVLAGLYEVDQFDDGHATYLIVVDQDDRHLASARLLHTIRPSPIESACPPFVEGIVPKGRDVWEITRICSLFPEGSDRVWEVHDMLLNGLAKFAVEAGVRTYTIIADPEHSSWFASVGWKCKRLGPAQYQGGQVFTALGIEIDPAIRANFMAGGIAGGSRLFQPETRAAAHVARISSANHRHHGAAFRRSLSRKITDSGYSSP